MMQVNDLMEIIKNESMENFIPLTDLPTELERKAYETKYKHQFWTFPHSATSFQEAYPRLDVTHIYCSRGVNPLYYWDEEQDLLLRIPVVLEAVHEAKEIEDTVLDEMARMRQSMENGDYQFIFVQLDGRMRVEYLAHLIEKGKTINDVYDLFLQCYRSADYGANHVPREILLQALEHRTEEEQLQFQKELEKLPERVTIYRGEGSRSTTYDRAYSWTLSPKWAHFFATRLEQENARIVVGSIARKDILSMECTGEQEVLVLPEDVEIHAIYHLPGREYVLEQNQKYHSLLEDYDPEQNNNLSDYDAGHAFRTVLLSVYLYDLRHPDCEFGRAHITLALAGFFHDTGRTEDGEERHHGVRSAEVFKVSRYGTYEEQEVVSFLIQAHDKPDHEVLSELRSQFPDPFEQNRVRELTYLLKDADALDRVRFGYTQEDSLDFTKLYYEESKTLLLAAEQLYKQTDFIITSSMEDVVEEPELQLSIE